MTSFGRAEAPLGARRLVAELRSVNHRFLELKLRLGRDDGELEVELGKAIRGRLERGAVSLSLREETDQGDAETAMIDEARAEAWMKALSMLATKIGATERPPLALVCAQPGVLRAKAAEVPRAVFAEAARKATLAALEAMIDARRREGEMLGRDLAERLRALRALREEVAKLAEGEPAHHFAKQKEHLAALLAAVRAEGDGADRSEWGFGGQVLLPPEIIERLDVSEELVRLGAHLDEAARLLESTGPAGRRLDFLSQEIHREVNTIGSKAQAVEMASKVVDMKVELERFREQVQNVE